MDFFSGVQLHYAINLEFKSLLFIFIFFNIADKILNAKQHDIIAVSKLTNLVSTRNNKRFIQI